MLTLFSQSFWLSNESAVRVRIGANVEGGATVAGACVFGPDQEQYENPPPFGSEIQ
jgi:hypothetical protein